MSSSTSPASSDISILVVDDEADVAEVFEALLLSEGYSVLRAASGQEAILRLQEKHYDLMLADIRMPKMSGLELLAWANKNQPDLRAILVTGLANLEMTKTALDLGCRAFLAKPVDRVELLKTVKFALTEASSDEHQEDNYGCVPIEDFISGKNLPYSIYVRLGEGRFVKIAHTGEDLDLGRIYNLKQKEVNELWLERADLMKYQQMSQRLAANVAGMTQVAIEKRARMIGHAGEIATQRLKLAGVDSGSLDTASQIMTAALTFSIQNPSASAMLDAMISSNNGRFSHSASTAMLAVLVTQVMGWTNKKNIFILSLGGFFHDVGLLEMPQGIEDKPLDQLSEKERELYLSHPDRGVQLLDEIPEMPRELLTIVAQHHESGKEAGFPRNIPVSEVFPMARIVRLLDEFSHRLLSTDLSARKPTKRLLDDILVEPTLGTFDFTTTCAMECLLESGQVASAKKRFAIAITEKRSV